MTLILSTDTKQELITAIKEFFRDQRDEQIGELQASILLDFILETIGPTIYNRAVRDVQTHLTAVLADLDVEMFESEGGQR